MKRPSRRPTRRATDAKSRELNLKIPIAQRAAEAARFRAQAAKSDFKSARKAYKQAKKLAKEARRKLKALRKALRQIAEAAQARLKPKPAVRVSRKKSAAKKPARRRAATKNARGPKPVSVMEPPLEIPAIASGIEEGPRSDFPEDNPPPEITGPAPAMESSPPAEPIP